MFIVGCGITVAQTDASPLKSAQRRPTQLTLPGKQKWPISANKDGKIDKYEHVEVCMMPQILDEKRIDDKHLDLEEKLYGAALMGLPCNKVDPLNFYLVD